jgi:hypothetical protein
MTVQVDTDMQRAFGQLYEIQKRLLNGALSPHAVRRGLQGVIEGKLPQGSRFGRYDDLLLSLEDQLDRLRNYNGLYWGGWLSDEQLSAIDTASDHVQSIDDLEVLHVSFGSPDVEMWWKVFVDEQPHAGPPDRSIMDAKRLRRLGHNVRTYGPGIHRVRINLVAHWELERSRSIDEVRKQAEASGEILAHSEVLSAYGIHSELLREQDGRGLPYAEMAGFELKSYSVGWPYCPYIAWDRLGIQVDLGAGWATSRNREWAAPTVKES